MRSIRLAFAMLAPLLLWGCLLTPGKFVSTMTINADRTFAFSYKGEVFSIDPDLMKGLGDKDQSAKGEPGGPDSSAFAAKSAGADDGADAKNRRIAAVLAKEEGYRSVVYRGKGKFDIDYAITGKLTHSYIFPFNIDAETVLPFVAVEVRKDGTVRVKAPGFANANSELTTGFGGRSGGAGDTGAALRDGSFTLDTDGAIVSQNNEDGTTGGGARKRVSWRITPLTKDAPTAVVRLAP